MRRNCSAERPGAGDAEAGPAVGSLHAGAPVASIVIQQATGPRELWRAGPMKGDGAPRLAIRIMANPRQRISGPHVIDSL